MGAVGVFPIKAIFVYMYLIDEGKDLTLIDCGLPGNHQRILSAIAERGLPPAALKRIIITHADGDHYGSLGEVKQSTRAHTCASPIEAAAIRNGQSSRAINPHGIVKLFYGLASPLFRAKPFSIDEMIEPGTIFPAMGGLQVLDTSGHTPGHISLFSPSTGILFAGDSIVLKAGKPAPSTGANTWNLEKAQQAFEIQMQLKPRIIYAGHAIIQ
jgi:glyoxylase-like metal-dependent hydrolase (beta-lactamase superfamily II)